MSAPKVSVIIPCYNMERFLGECLESVLSQSLKEIEAVCINDGSRDATPQILEGYRETDPRVRVLHQENQGVAAARNNGIRTAAGEYVIFLDPDDFYPNEKTLEQLYTSANQNGALICGGSFSSYNNDTKKVSTYYTGDSAKYLFKKEGFVAYRDYQFDFGYHRFLYNREFLLEKDIFFPPYARYQDPPFFAEAMIAAEKFYAIPDVVYRYRYGMQENAVNWAPKKLHDMMRGHLDVLKMSAREGLAELHALTVRRFETENVTEPVMKSLNSGDEETLALLKQINDAVDPALLDQAGMPLTEEDSYTLCQLRAYETGCETVAAPAWKKSGSFFSRAVQKLRGGIQCCAENGVAYTLKLGLKKLGARRN